MKNNLKTRIQIYTDPEESYGLIFNTKRWIKQNYLNRYPGHHGVTRSLCNGFEIIKQSYSLNSRYKFIGEDHTIICLSGVATLKSLINWKFENKRKNKIYAGPNILVRSNDHEKILGNKYIDGIITPSSWVKDAYIEDLPSISEKIHVWPAGIDIDYWQPLPDSSPQKKVLIYCKNNFGPLVPLCLELLNKYSLDFVVLNYGTHKHIDLKNALDNSKFCIYFSKCESQGLALSEMWAMNCKTYVYQPQVLEIDGRNYNKFSSAPYLVNETGEVWSDLNVLEKLISKQDTHLLSCREYVEANLSDEVCARKLLSILE